VTEIIDTPTRSYGCSFGCGNPYDFILVDVRAGTTELLCLPCYVKLASDMVTAVTEANDPQVMAALAYAASGVAGQAPGPAGRKRGHNAPGTSDDITLFDAFDSVITEGELPEEFR
jgi:hypothetical protein